MRPRVRKLRRWSFVVTLPLAGLLIWRRGLEGAAFLPAFYVLLLGAILVAARRIGGPRGELLLDLVMHPVGRRAFRTELRLVATLARAVQRVLGPGDRGDEFAYHGRSSELAMLLAFVPALVGEIVVVELLLSGQSLWLRLAVAGISLYGFAWLTAWTVGLRVYPHRVRDGVLEARLGTFYRVAVPLQTVATLDVAPRRPAKRTELLLTDGAAALAVDGHVDLRLRLTRPVSIERPLGDPIEVTQLELAADEPAALAHAIGRMKAECSGRLGPPSQDPPSGAGD